jgi:hypothetical protein
MKTYARSVVRCAFLLVLCCLLPLGGCSSENAETKGQDEKVKTDEKSEKIKSEEQSKKVEADRRNEKVEIDGRTVRLKDSQCTLTFESVREFSEEEIRKKFVNPEALAGLFDEHGKNLWVLKFSHTGDHRLIDYEIRNGAVVLKSEFVCIGKDGKNKTISYDISDKSVDVFTAGDSPPVSAAIEHKGYLLTYNFDSGSWSYKALGKE